ncbi:hypothetical protein MRX96_054318 [Rhipicephalus microplus]
MTPRDDDEDLRTPPPPPLKFGVTAILADHGAVHARDKERIFGGAARSAAAASLLAAAAATGGKPDLRDLFEQLRTNSGFLPRCFVTERPKFPPCKDEKVPGGIPCVPGGELHSKWRGGVVNAALMVLVLRTMSSAQCQPLMCGAPILVCLSHLTTCQGASSPYLRLLAANARTLGYFGRAGGELPVSLTLGTITSSSLRHSQETCEDVVERRRTWSRGVCISGAVKEDGVQRKRRLRSRTGS